MARSMYRKIGLATLIMMGSIFLSRVLGVLRESILAALCGAGVAVDAYKAAFILPEILNHIVASGFFSVTFIPIFSRYLTEKNESGGWHIFSTILTVFGILLTLFILLSMMLAPQLVPLLTAGRSDPQFQAMAIRMTRIILPAQLFFFIGGIFMAVQFAKEHFLLPALAGLVYNIGIISGGVLLVSVVGVEGFAWGALIGAFVGNFLIQWIGAKKVNMRFCFSFDWRHPDLYRYLALTLPLMVGLTMMFSTEVFFKLFGSFLPVGAIAHIDFAWRIVLLLVGFFGQAVGVASYPYLARLAAEKQYKEMNRLLNNTLRYLALVIPVAFLVYVLRHEIVRVLFERGRFSASDAHATALALSGMLIGAVAFASQTVVNRGFYAVQNTLLPAVYGSVAVMLSLPFYWVGLKTLGVLGIGLAISFSAIVQVCLLFAIWNKKSGNSESRLVYRFYLKTLILSLPIAALLMGTRKVLLVFIDNITFWGSMALILVLGIVFLLLMALATWLFNIEESRVIWYKLVSRLRPGRALLK